MQLNPSKYVNVYTFNPTDVKIVSVPVGANIVAFSSTGHFFVNFNGGVANGSPVADGSGDELNPTTRYLVEEMTLFTIFAPAAITISVAFYGLQ
jgi:hypothetical protein